MKRKYIYIIIICVYLSGLILVPRFIYEQELDYYKKKGYKLQTMSYEELRDLASQQEVVFEKEVSRVELREFAELGLKWMGHNIVYYNRTARLIFVGRARTVFELMDLRIRGRFLIYRWRQGF